MKKLTQRINRMLDELRASPGVRAAATSATLPGVLADWRTEIKLEGRAEREGKIVADSRFVSNGYFVTMQIPVLAGEGCRESLNLESVVVNRSFANAYLSGSPAIGHHLQMVSNQFLPSPAEIRGIVADAREQGLNREPAPTVYWCVSAPDPSPHFLIRTQGEPMAMAQMLRRKIHQIEPARSVFDISPLEQHLSDSFAENRLRTILLTLFALTAISLACVGLYGTLSYFVTVRKREVGLRLALGAVRGPNRYSFPVQRPRGIIHRMYGRFVSGGGVRASALGHVIRGIDGRCRNFFLRRVSRINCRRTRFACAGTPRRPRGTDASPPGRIVEAGY